MSRAALYYKPRKPSQEDLDRLEKLMARIDYWHTELPCSGSRKLTRLLQGEGYSIGRKQVRHLMGQMGLRVIYPKPNLSKRNFQQSVCPYLLRNLNIFLPNQVWAIDITYIKMERRHMYLTAIIDWFSRRIVGWTLSDTLNTAPVLDCVKTAVERFGVPAILNSDQGSQFTSDEYKALLKQYGIRQSMDGKARWADNVRMERWFRSLKTELIYINEFGSPKALRRAIRDYIQQYNTVRPHEALDYATPEAAYSRQFALPDAGLDRALLAG